MRISIKKQFVTKRHIEHFVVVYVVTKFGTAELVDQSGLPIDVTYNIENVRNTWQFLPVVPPTFKSVRIRNG